MGAPSLLDAQAGQVLERINGLCQWAANNCTGGIVSDGGTTQASGANGVLNFDIDATEIFDAVVDGISGHVLAAQTDADSDAASGLAWGETDSVQAIFAVILDTGAADDTPAMSATYGAVAATGSAVAPTDAEIETFITHSNWMRLADVTITRTGDTAVTFAVDNGVRPTARFNTDLAETETAFRS